VSELLRAAQFVELARDQLALCGVGPGTAVMVYADPEGRDDLHAACLAAAGVLGADAFTVTVPSLAAMRASLPEAVRLAAAHVDLVIDLSGRGMLHSTMQATVLAAGARILRAREPLEVLARLTGSPRVRDLVARSGACLDRATTMAVATAAGTDVTFDVGGRSASRQFGSTDVPGRWDHWGTGLVALAPIETAGAGTLVLAPGDLYFLSATRGIAVSEAVRIQLADGAITSIEGGVDAERIGAALDVHRFGPDARRLSHVGWGCDDRAQWDALERYGADGGGGADVRSVAGGVVIAFGANADLGGSNETVAHMDLALRHAEVRVDGQVVVERGALVGAALPDEIEPDEGEDR
jgi:2,5-dihydroxypyridine 5,6-dioxygenase